MEAERKLEEKKLQDLRETSDRLTAASHVQVEYFAKHQKIEGYYESQMPGRLFGCDRLMKQDNMFGTLQLGYNPNRERVFLFANMKTSRYDTVASRYQKESQRGKDKKEAVAIAHKTSMLSIVTSGCSFFACTFGISVYSQVDMIGSICTLLSRGALISMIVVIFVLPAMFMLFDKLIVKTSIGFLGKKKKAVN